MAKSNRSGDVQYGMLPYRITADGEVEVMLLTSRGTGRWVIPKGWPMIGKKPRVVAMTEARQEAGISGIVGRRPIGSFPYCKTMEDGEGRLCKCIVFLMRVTRERLSWREQAQRRRAWFPHDLAANLVEEGALVVMIHNLLHTLQKVAPTLISG
jgi:8-oxo-dGTP pyrophosphatase MutT (NUDIX family)